MDVPLKGDLPGLYHPKAGNQNAWLEMSMGALLQPTEGFAKRWMAKQGFKGNVAGLMFSLVGQHYFFTFKHSVKKQSLEPQIRQYAEKNLKAWSEAAAKGKHSSKDLQTVSARSRAMGKMAEQKGGGGAEKGMTHL